MSILNTGSVMKRITNALSILTTNVQLHNSRGRTDINRDAEEFYCGLLNIVLNASLSNLNALQMDFPAIDLADKSIRLCVQVTSTKERRKIKSTLSKFFAHGLQKDYSRLIIVIIGRTNQCQGDFWVPDGFTFDKQTDIWDTEHLLNEIEKMDDETKRRIDNYLRVNLDIIQPQRHRLRLPIPEQRNPVGFLGRVGDLKEIRRRMDGQERPVIIAGLGGVGKTMLATHYARERRGNVLFVRFDTSFTHTLADAIGGCIPLNEREGLSKETIAKLALELLEQCGEDDLLIIDNAENPGKSWRELTEDACYKKLRALPMAVLITTRNRDTGGIWLGNLEQGELRQIFRGYQVDIPEGKMDSLINAVGGHTMTVDMIARTIRESWGVVTPENILQAMEESTLKDGEYDEIENDHDPEQRQIYAHLRALFDLSSITEEGKNALCCATLLPQSGMRGDIFLNALPKKAAKEIKTLEKRGWVDYENGNVSIHPVIRLLCRTELTPTGEKCEGFLCKISEQFDPAHYCEETYRQYAELFYVAAVKLNQSSSRWLRQFFVFFWVLWVKEKRNPLPDTHENARVLDDIGCILKDDGQYGEAIELFKEAIRIRESRQLTDKFELADSYTCVGYCSGAMGDSAQACYYIQKAIDIQTKVYSADLSKLAKLYCAAGMAYSDLGEFEIAFRYLLDAIEIIVKTNSDDQNDLESCISALVMTYGRIGGIDKAIHYLEQALRRASIAKDYNKVMLVLTQYRKMSEFGINEWDDTL